MIEYQSRQTLIEGFVFSLSSYFSGNSRSIILNEKGLNKIFFTSPFNIVKNSLISGFQIVLSTFIYVVLQPVLGVVGFVISLISSEIPSVIIEVLQVVLNILIGAPSFIGNLVFFAVPQLVDIDYIDLAINWQFLNSGYLATEGNFTNFNSNFKVGIIGHFNYSTYKNYVTSKKNFNAVVIAKDLRQINQNTETFFDIVASGLYNIESVNDLIFYIQSIEFGDYVKIQNASIQVCGYSSAINIQKFQLVSSPFIPLDISGLVALEFSSSLVRIKMSLNLPSMGFIPSDETINILSDVSLDVTNKVVSINFLERNLDERKYTNNLILYLFLNGEPFTHANVFAGISNILI